MRPPGDLSSTGKALGSGNEFDLGELKYILGIQIGRAIVGKYAEFSHDSGWM